MQETYKITLLDHLWMHNTNLPQPGYLRSSLKHTNSTQQTNAVHDVHAKSRKIITARTGEVMLRRSAL